MVSRELYVASELVETLNAHFLFALRFAFF